MPPTCSLALLAAVVGSQAACCLSTIGAEVSGTTATTSSSGGNSPTAGSGGGITGTASTTGGNCTALDPSPLEFSIAQVGECIFDRTWGPDGGPGLIAVSVLISGSPLVQDTFGCSTNGPALELSFGSPESLDGPALVPGTYQIPGALDGGWLRASYLSDTANAWASNGIVTFTSVSSIEVIGSFSVVFVSDGGSTTTLSGAFCAPYFGNLNLPP